MRGRSELPPSLPPSLVSLSLCLYLSLSDSLRREIVRRSRYLCRAEAQWIKKVACYQATREAACNEVTPLAQQTEQRSHHPTHGSESRIKCSNLLINCCRFNGLMPRRASSLGARTPCRQPSRPKLSLLRCPSCLGSAWTGSSANFVSE